MTLSTKRNIGIVLCAMLLFVLAMPVGTAFAGAAHARSWQDAWYYIESSGQGHTWTTPRAKDDKTSSWNNNYSANADHSAQIGALPSQDGNVSFVSPTYYWYSGKEGYMLNNVIESGNSWATLWISGAPFITAEGYWSPDSI